MSCFHNSLYANTIKNVSSEAIYINEGENHLISNNTIENARHGILLYMNAHNNIIKNNMLTEIGPESSSSSYGIWLDYVSSSYPQNNTINNNLTTNNNLSTKHNSKNRRKTRKKIMRPVFVIDTSSDSDLSS